MIAGGGYLEHDMCTIAGETGRFLQIININTGFTHVKTYKKHLYTHNSDVLILQIKKK